MTTTLHSGRMVFTNMLSKTIGIGADGVGDPIDMSEGRFAAIIIGESTGGGLMTFTVEGAAAAAGPWTAIASIPTRTLNNEPWLEGQKAQNEARTKGWLLDGSRSDIPRFVRVVASTTVGNFVVWVTCFQWGGSGPPIANFGVSANNIVQKVHGT